VDNPLDRVASLIRLTRDPSLVQWLCHQAGGFFVRNPKGRTRPEQRDVFPATNEIIQQFADVLESITDAAADQSISKPEAEAIRRQWDELKAFTEGFVRCCEEGDFTRIRGGTAPAPSP
jgi:hypothetical protein